MRLVCQHLVLLVSAALAHTNSSVNNRTRRVQEVRAPRSYRPSGRWTCRYCLDQARPALENEGGTPIRCVIVAVSVYVRVCVRARAIKRGCTPQAKECFSRVAGRRTVGNATGPAVEHVHLSSLMQRRRMAACVKIVSCARPTYASGLHKWSCTRHEL